MKKIVIIGASGHGKVVADIARLNGYEEILFLDDNKEIEKCGEYNVVGTTDIFEQFDSEFVVGIGDSGIRKKLMNRLEKSNKRIVTLIHPNAVIAEDVIIGNGSVGMAGAVINPGTRIGIGAIINTCSSVDHDCIIGNYVHVAVGAHICGSVMIGDNTWMGAGSLAINNIHICENCMIGAGAVIIKNLDESGMYIGVPAIRK